MLKKSDNTDVSRGETQMLREGEKREKKAVAAGRKLAERVTGGGENTHFMGTFSIFSSYYITCHQLVRWSFTPFTG